MNAPQFTPGPWSVSSAPRTYERILGPSDETIAETGAWGDSFKDEIRANARLIAAAPELYEALILASKMLVTLGNVEPDVIRKALAKARGAE